MLILLPLPPVDARAVTCPSDIPGDEPHELGEDGIISDEDFEDSES